MIIFELSLYEIREDVKTNNLALSVCLEILELSSERTIRISTVSGSAQGVVARVTLYTHVRITHATSRSQC